jgi:hypothetical protein
LLRRDLIANKNRLPSYFASGFAFQGNFMITTKLSGKLFFQTRIKGVAEPIAHKVEG